MSLNLMKERSEQTTNKGLVPLSFFRFRTVGQGDFHAFTRLSLNHDITCLGGFCSARMRKIATNRR